MANTFESSYDGIAGVYEKWCMGDPAFGPCHDYYIQALKDVEGPLVELGIGTGMIALPLVQKYGKHVIGIDESAQMLGLAQKKYDTGQKNGTLTLQKGNFLDLTLPRRVPCIYIPFRTIGHIVETEDVLRLFRRIHQNLEDNGLLLFDHYVFCRAWADAHNRKRILMYEDPQIRIEDYYRYDFARERMDCSVFVNDLEVSRFEFAYHKVGYYQELLEQSSFAIEQLYGGYDHSMLTEYAVEQIYVCRRK